MKSVGNGLPKDIMTFNNKDIMHSICRSNEMIFLFFKVQDLDSICFFLTVIFYLKDITMKQNIFTKFW